jgi:two-component system sensor histidine kinase UhpB
LKQHVTTGPGSIRADHRKWPVVVSEQKSDQLYWMVATDYLFAVRVLPGRRFSYETINPAFASILGVSSNDIGGLPVSDCLSGEDARSVFKILRACRAEGGQVRVRHRLALGGSERDFETIVTPARDPDTGSITRLLGSHRDVSDYSFGSVADWLSGTDTNERLISIQEDVQQRIASDLHDSTCQHLIAASLGVMRVRSTLGDRASAERLCDDVDTSIDQALGEIRTYVYLLYPRNLTVDGLKIAIEQYAGGFETRTALKVRTKISPEIDSLAYDSQRSLLRVVQEALTNVLRHARATEVEILGKVADSHCELRISDNGRGMPAGRAGCGTSAISLGVGIPAMKARLQRIGGRLETWSAPGQGLAGTTLCAIVPLTAANNEGSTSQTSRQISELKQELKICGRSPVMQSGGNSRPRLCS